MTACTPASLAEVVARFGGLRSGEHAHNAGECCILEAVSVCDGVPWTADPRKLDRPDIRPLNDASWSSDALRTEAEIRARIKDIKSDERMHQPSATVIENAPLALIQLEGEATAAALQWALGERAGCAGSYRHVLARASSAQPDGGAL